MYASTRNGRSSDARPSSSPRTIVSSPPRWRPRTSASNVTVGSGSAMPGIIARRGQRRSHHRLGRADRLRGGAVLRRSGPATSSGSTTTCARTSSAPTASTAAGARAAASASWARYAPRRPRHPRPRRRARAVRAAAAPRSRWSSTAPASRRTTGPRREPFTDFDVNAGGTLNLLEATRLHAPDAPFIFMSTNKVYGDAPNALPLVELEHALGDRPGHTVRATASARTMSIDGCLHSLFGASKVAADVMVQEYGRYFGLRTACFRRRHADRPAARRRRAARLPRLRDALRDDGPPYTVFGYQGKQVRDAIHCARPDRALRLRVPRAARRRGLQHRRRPVSATARCSRRSRWLRRSPARELAWRYDETQPRSATTSGGSATTRRFAGHYPEWRQEYDVPRDPDRDARGQRGALARVIDAGKRVLLGVRLDAVDYEAALSRILAAARAGQPLGVSALAVHGVMTGVHRRRAAVAASTISTSSRPTASRCGGR